jgi:hypothetical protein
MIDENILHDTMLERPLISSIPSLPSALTFNSERYSTIIPTVKEVSYSPNTGIMYSSNNSTNIKFLFSSTGFLDPYNLFFEFEIGNMNGHPLKFDNSAHSIISSLTISTNGTVLEEITDYDVIQSLIFDNTYSQDIRKMKFNECFGTKIDDFGLKNANDEPILSGTNIDNPLQQAISLNDGIHGVKHNLVRNGQLVIGNNAPPNSLKIRLPLMSTLFGFGILLQHYKWIPLEFFPNFEISINLNPFALFIPLSPIVDMNNQNEQDATVLDNFIPLVTNDSKFLSSRRYQISNTKIVTSQLFFDSTLMNTIRNVGLKNGLVIDTQIWQSFQHKFFRSAVENTYLLNIPRRSIRSVVSLFLHRNYEIWGFVRKLKKYSRGITEFQVKIGEEYYPNQSLKGNASNNTGIDNNYDFYKNALRIFNKIGYVNESITTPTNYAIDNYPIDEQGLPLRNIINPGVFVNGTYTFIPKWVLHTFTSEEIIGRCFFGISLDQIPYSGDLYKSGVDTRFTKPILLMFKQDANKSNEQRNLLTDERFVQYVLLEYDYTLKVSLDGTIRKDF